MEVRRMRMMKWLLVCLAVRCATGAVDCRRVSGVSCSPQHGLALGRTEAVPHVDVQLLGQKPQTESVHLTVTFPDSTTAEIHEELRGVGANTSLPVVPPVLTSSIQILSAPAVCLRITATACSMETSLPSPPLGYPRVRLTRALASNSRRNDRPSPTVYSWLWLVAVGGAGIMTLTLLTLTTMCCRKHSKLEDEESPFRKHNPMGSPLQDEEKESLQQDAPSCEEEEEEEVSPTDKEFGHHPLGSPTFSTFQSLDELDALPSSLTHAHTSLTKEQKEAEQELAGCYDDTCSVLTSTAMDQEATGIRTTSLEAVPPTPITPVSSYPSTSSHPSTSSCPSTSSYPSSTSHLSTSSHPSTSSRPSTSSHPSTSSRPSTSSQPSTSSRPSTSSHLSTSSQTSHRHSSLHSDSDATLVEPPQAEDADHEEPIYYRLMSKQSSRLSSQDSEEGTSLDVGTRDPNVGAEGESSLDRGTRPSSTASLLCTQDSGETSLDRGTRQTATAVPVPGTNGMVLREPDKRLSSADQPYCSEGPTFPSTPPPIPPPVPPRKPSSTHAPTAVLCSMCGQEIRGLPRNEEGEPFYLVLLPHCREGEEGDSQQPTSGEHRTFNPGLVCPVLESGTAVCLKCSRKTVEASPFNGLESSDDVLGNLPPPPIPPRDNPPPKSNDPLYEKIGSLQRSARPPLCVQFSTDSNVYCSLKSEEGSYITTPKPRTLKLHTGSSTDYETISSLNSSSPYYYKASDIQEIAAMFAKPDSHTPSLSTFQTQGSPPSPHDYESLPSSFNQAFLSRMGSEDYTRIGPAPCSGATSPPWIPEGAARSQMLRIDSHGYALVLERQAQPDSEVNKVNNANDAWQYQLERGYAPLTLPRKDGSRNEEGATSGRSPSLELATPQDYEVPIHLPLSIPSPRLIRQKRVLSETEQTPTDHRVSILSDSVFPGQEELEEVVEEQSSNQQADELRITGASSVQPTPTSIPTRPRAMTVGAQGARAASIEDTQPQRKSLPTTLHICLNQQSGVVV